jgi:tetratricopeptide (TPR) repeat protein
VIDARAKVPMAVFVLSCMTYALLAGPFSAYMREKPIEEKLGYVPSVKLVRLMSADHRESAAAFLVLKVIVYFGGIVDKQQSNVITAPPDYLGMSRLLHNAVYLDPYNMDAYYFAQSFLTWEAKQVQVANKLLENGMKYRTWDWYLPFFAGFNYAYFLKDYENAARYYKRAADLTGNELYISLTGRYLQSSGQTGLAVAYLSTMLKTARDETARKSFKVRLLAFQEVLRIEHACEEFVQNKGRMPKSLAELEAAGLLADEPVDPYGGHFYLENDGKVNTTSKFAFPVKDK